MRRVTRTLARPRGLLGGVIVLAWLAGLAAPGAPDTPSIGLLRLTVTPPTGGAPIPTLVWYPASATPVETALGPYVVAVAPNAAPNPGRWPLVVISHGTGGAGTNHYDIARALVERGFIVATPTHPGDNFRDTSAFGTTRQLYDRPRHVTLVIDALLVHPVLGAHVDPDRIAAIGHSAGGYTALVLAGGVPDLERVSRYYREHPDDPVLRLGSITRDPTSAAPPGELRDSRVKAIVLMAPVLGVAFAPDGLARVTVPVKLYVAERDELVVPAANAERIRALLPRPPELEVVPGAGHYVFIAPCPDGLRREVPIICTDAPGVDRAKLHARFGVEIADFLRRALR